MAPSSVLFRYLYSFSFVDPSLNIRERDRGKERKKSQQSYSEIQWIKHPLIATYSWVKIKTSSVKGNILPPASVFHINRYSMYYPWRAGPDVEVEKRSGGAWMKWRFKALQRLRLRLRRTERSSFSSLLNAPLSVWNRVWNFLIMFGERCVRRYIASTRIDQNVSNWRNSHRISHQACQHLFQA